MKIAIIRGSYFNRFEMQNYESLVRDFNLVGFSGLKPIHEKYSFPLIKLPSPVDLPDFPKKMALLNRLFLGDGMYLFGLEGKLKGFDIVHVRETYFHFTSQAINAKKKGLVKKVVCTCSETIPFNHEGIWGRKKLKQKAISSIDKFHCLTEKARQALIKEGCNPKKTVVFPYGVNTSIFKPVKKKKKKNINLLFIGRLVKEKGIYDLLKVFIKLKKEYRNILLTMIGRGEEKDSLLALLEQINFNKFVKIKTVSYKDIAKEYQKADIFILLSRPSRHWEEYLGMVLLEAMASGLPVVSTKSGAIPETVGKAGFLVKPGNWQQALKILKNLCNNKSLREKFGRIARKRAVEEFTAEKAGLNLKNFYQSLNI
jgi:alpha-maltose-1-phosphate synthase